MAAFIRTETDTAHATKRFDVVSEKDKENLGRLEQEHRNIESTAEDRMLFDSGNDSMLNTRFDIIKHTINTAWLPNTLRSLNDNMCEDFNTWHLGLSVVSEKFKSCIESVEADNHHFYPVNIVNRKGDVLGKAYFWRTLNIFNAIVPNVNGIKRVVMAPVENLHEAELDGIRLYRDIVSEKAAWYDIRLGEPLLASEKFVALAKKQKLTNLSFSHSFEEC
ncbi:imm11 family protein [Enterovibrio norvegicus]|uniref:Immunity MXAN-0049 protein domain-containing protein n=1 Tax=Enterovibrio norvegicus DSM 15893 TaxID=1121869 RepID=A0A1I5S703_9GAMM|nr:DUF1629 domain-containing protein [Enterovibrio norvegicus]SFP66026.1 hypothetical protein SAMN03084138_02785 [Enterovibrio norvegicus DSM 15893]